jgi:hypothetical protein
MQGIQRDIGPAPAALYCHADEHLSEAGSESRGIAAARRHTNNNEMAVHVPAVSSSRFSMVISLEWSPGKSYAAIGDISIRDGVENR